MERDEEGTDPSLDDGEADMGEVVAWVGRAEKVVEEVRHSSVESAEPRYAQSPALSLDRKVVRMAECTGGQLTHKHQQLKYTCTKIF